MSAPESATPEKQQDLINCLDDETVFTPATHGDNVGPLPGPAQRGHLSLHSRRTEGIDVRSVMLAGIGGDEEAAMIGGMAAMFTTMSCLKRGGVSPQQAQNWV